MASGDIDGDGLAELSLYAPQTGAVLLLHPEPAGALQVTSAIWPTGWTLQGYTVHETLDLALAAPDLLSGLPGEDAIDAADVQAALRALGLQITPLPVGRAAPADHPRAP